MRETFVSNTGSHSEELMIDFLKENNIPGENVTRIFSEREPCVKTKTSSKHNCAEKIMEYMPDAEVIYVVDYGITEEEGKQARNILRQLFEKILK